MAMDWIAWTKGLTVKREIIALSARLGKSRPECAVHCMVVWEWADDQTVDGDVDGVPLEFLDEITGVPGFGKHLQGVGWVEVNPGADGEPPGLLFPNWDRFNSRTAKKRMLQAERTRRSRARDKADRDADR